MKTKMALFDEIASGFQQLNIAVSKSVLERCEELCRRYNMESEDLIDVWLAYTASNLNGEPPSLDALDKMERKELQNKPSTSITSSLGTPTWPNESLPMEVTPSTLDPVIEDKHEETVSQGIPFESFSQRTGSRLVQCEFGKCDLHSFRKSASLALDVKVHNQDIINSKYMYEKLILRRQALNAVTKLISGEIIDHYKLELTNRKLKDYFGNMVICGRIYSENPGRLNVQTLLIEGVLESYGGHTMKLSLYNLDKFSLFSGQVVVIEGINRKTFFDVEKLYSNVPPALPSTPVILEEPLQIVVGVGPFTLANNILYEALEDLLTYVVEYKPNLLILMGPFVEATHPVLENSNECYDTFFESIVDVIMERIKDIPVQVILVPSEKDINNHPIFPSLPFKLQKQRANLICAPNPFIIEVNNLVIGGSTTDILHHLAASEIFRPLSSGTSDKMTRLVSYVVGQRSFYPLYPPHPDTRVDYELLVRHGMFEILPHILFLPSNVGHFVKNIDGCVVVNPSRLLRGQHPGTFARMEISPGSGVVSKRVLCQVLRI